MTLKEIDKKISKIKKDLHSIEYEVTRKKRILNKKKSTTVEEWTRLGDEISEKWDGVSLEDEIKYQREKN